MFQLILTLKERHFVSNQSNSFVYSIPKSIPSTFYSLPLCYSYHSYHSYHSCHSYHSFRFLPVFKQTIQLKGWRTSLYSYVSITSPSLKSYTSLSSSTPHSKPLYLNSAFLSLFNTLHFILKMPNRIEPRSFKHNLPLISGIPKIPPHSEAHGKATASSTRRCSLCTLRSGFSHFLQKSARYLEFQKSAFKTSAVETVTGAFTIGMNSEAFVLSWILGIPKIGTLSRSE